MFDPITQSWLASCISLSALALAAWLLVRRVRAGTWSLPLIVSSAGLMLFGLGGAGLLESFGVDPDALSSWAFWLVAAPLGAFAVMLGVLVGTGKWSAPVGWFLGAVLAFGLGHVTCPPLQSMLADAAKLAR